MEERGNTVANYMTHLSDYVEHVLVVENDLRYIVASSNGFLVYKTTAYV